MEFHFRFFLQNRQAHSYGEENQLRFLAYLLEEIAIVISKFAACDKTKQKNKRIISRIKIAEIHSMEPNSQTNALWLILVNNGLINMFKKSMCPDTAPASAYL